MNPGVGPLKETTSGIGVIPFLIPCLSHQQEEKRIGLLFCICVRNARYLFPYRPLVPCQHKAKGRFRNVRAEPGAKPRSQSDQKKGKFHRLHCLPSRGQMATADPTELGLPTQGKGRSTRRKKLAKKISQVGQRLVISRLPKEKAVTRDHTNPPTVSLALFCLNTAVGEGCWRGVKALIDILGGLFGGRAGGGKGPAP